MTTNLLAVLVAAFVSMAVGALWYGPIFGKTFMQAMGWQSKSQSEKDAMKQGMMLNYLWQFIASLVMFFVLARIIGRSYEMTMGRGLYVAFWIWLGFIVPVKFGDGLWGGKWTLFWLGIGNMFITLMLAGAIIGAWK